MSENNKIKCCYCNEILFLDDDTKTFNGFFQCLGCHKLSAIEIGNDIFPINEILDFNKMENKIKGWKNIDNVLKCSFLHDEFPRKICYVMNSKGRMEEDTHFTSIDDISEIVLLANDKEFLGYIVWTNVGDMARLNQIFILPQHRKNDYASKLLNFWVQEIADKKNERFEVYGPNEKAEQLLIKLGYCELEGDYIINKKAILIPYLF
jgi:hypothetical protein